MEIGKIIKLLCTTHTDSIRTLKHKYLGGWVDGQAFNCIWCLQKHAVASDCNCYIFVRIIYKGDWLYLYCKGSCNHENDLISDVLPNPDN